MNCWPRGCHRDHGVPWDPLDCVTIRSRPSERCPGRIPAQLSALLTPKTSRGSHCHPVIPGRPGHQENTAFTRPLPQGCPVPAQTRRQGDAGRTEPGPLPTRCPRGKTRAVPTPRAEAWEGCPPSTPRRVRKGPGFPRARASGRGEPTLCPLPGQAPRPSLTVIARTLT